MDDTNIDVEATITKKPMSVLNLPKPLTLEEKKYLLAVERGDMPNVRRMLQKAHRHHHININCVDSLGRGALSISIDGENLEMVELLVIMGVQTKDGLLHAINAEFVEAVELLLEHEELIHKEGEPYSWQTVDLSTATFTPDITPLILAAHRNNYEILKILLDRGATIPMPHDIKCGCDDCIRESKEDSLRHSLSRLNEYKALASPSLIALSSSDPILTAFQLSWELRNLAFAEPECKSEYLELRKQCQQFAVDLLHQSRSSEELAIILNHDPDSPPYQDGDHMKLARLELAIIYKQKKFVAHPNIQQLLAAIWYEGVPGFRRKSTLQKLIIIIRTAVLFPLYCMLYMLKPHTHSGKLMRKPFMKFLIHASAYLFFLLILILVSQRAEDQLIQLFGSESMKAERFVKQRGNPPAILEYVVLIYVLGYIYEETYEIYIEGMHSYLRNLWNSIDFTRNFLYCLVFLLRVAAYIQQTSEIARDPSTAYIPREQWNAFDPQLIAEGLFAAANIFSALKLVHLFSINPHLGPLQISLGRMVIDIVKFFFIYSLVLFAFACGLNQLLWYFSDLERKKCYILPNGEPDWENRADSCMKWRSFANVFESSQSLFWASFGMVDLGNFELTGIKSYTRFWGLLMFGSYSVINVIVLLNLLIAMMSNSYAMIDEHSDTEWKFARTKLWMSYFEEGNTLPPPFNIFPTVKTFMKLFRLRKKDKLRRMSTKRRQKEEKERDYRYTSVMRALVWRYISSMHKKCEEDMVTEDDINEVKSDISAFRYDILEVLNNNGMDISSVEKGDKAVLGKKMKIWERRLMKDFKVAPVVTEEEAEQLAYETPPENEDALSKFRRIAKLAVLNTNLNKWRQVVTGACLASQIGHCSNKDSLKKQQNLMKAMEEARRYVTRSPLSQSRPPTPIELPDITGQSIIELLKEIKDPNETKPFENALKVSSSMKNPLQPNVLISQHPSISLSPPTPTCSRQTDTCQIGGKKRDAEVSSSNSETKLPNSGSRKNSSDTVSSLPNVNETSSKEVGETSSIEVGETSSIEVGETSSKEVGDFIMLESQPGSPEPKLTDPLTPTTSSSEGTLTKLDQTEQGDLKADTETTLDGQSKTAETCEDVQTQCKSVCDQQQSGEIKTEIVHQETHDQCVEEKRSSALSDQEAKETLKDVCEDVMPRCDLQTLQDENVETVEPKPLPEQNQSETAEGQTDKQTAASDDQTKEDQLNKTEEEAVTEESKIDKDEKSTPTAKAKSRKGQAPAVPEIKINDDSSATNTRPQEDSDKSASVAKPKDSLGKPNASDVKKSPMAARNITRIGDKSARRQPRSGWL